jgi:hypothetical protein
LIAAGEKGGGPARRGVAQMHYQLTMLAYDMNDKPLS